MSCDQVLDYHIVVVAVLFNAQTELLNELDLSRDRSVKEVAWLKVYLLFNLIQRKIDRLQEFFNTVIRMAILLH